MEIKQKRIKVKDIYDGFIDNGDDGVTAYNGNLAVRPPYQREFVYDLAKSESVIQTVLKNFPLNIMYWVKVGENKYEILDGQQRTLSIMYYLKHKFPITIDDKKYYEDSLPNDLYDKILDYEFDIYICDGSESEKLDWFKVVNIAGEKLTEQELRNSVYTGLWLTDAKKYFSKRSCAAKGLSDRFITGDPNRQELLEKALKGICEYNNIKDITDYMSYHRKDNDAVELWQYFQDAINWIDKIFPQYYSDMKGLDWLHLYNKYNSNKYNSTNMVNDCKVLHDDEDVQKKSGIYEYLLAKDFDPFAQRFLNIRSFDDRDKRTSYSKQNGVCPICKNKFRYEEMEGDHIIPWSEGGHTILENCQMLCKNCNRKKSNK